MRLNASFASTPARSTMPAKPAVVKGAPRSEVKTNGDFGSWSRRSCRSARDSSPRIGYVLALFEPTAAQGAGSEIDLVPAQVDQFRRP